MEKEPTDAPLDVLIQACFTDPKPQAMITFMRHPDGYKVKAYAADGSIHSARIDDIRELPDVTRVFLAGLLTPSPAPEKQPEATPSSAAPEEPLSPHHTDAAPLNQAAADAAHEEATQARSYPR